MSVGEPPVREQRVRRPAGYPSQARHLLAGRTRSRRRPVAAGDTNADWERQHLLGVASPLLVTVGGRIVIVVDTARRRRRQG